MLPSPRRKSWDIADRVQSYPHFPGLLLGVRGDKVQNVHLGSCAKIEEETARQKARKMKTEALSIRM